MTPRELCRRAIEFDVPNMGQMGEYPLAHCGAP